MSSGVRTIPIWLSLFIILLCLGGGGAFIWWYFNGDALAGRTVIIPKDVLEKERAARAAENPRPRPQRGPNNINLNDPDGIRADAGATTGENATGRWTVKGGDAVVFVQSVGEKPVTYRYRFDYLRQDLVTPDQFQVIVATRRLVQDKAMAKAVGLSEEQQKKLAENAPRIGIFMSGDDRKSIETLFTKYLTAANDADRQKAGKDVVAALMEIGKRQLEPTRQKLVERVERVKALLTAEQWETWKKVGA